MKKIGIINQPISAVVAGLGHTDTVVIADAGLPIPAGPQRIDLALTDGIPTFFDTLRVVLTEMQVERAIVAAEMLEVSPERLPGSQRVTGKYSDRHSTPRNLQRADQLGSGGHPHG